MRIHGQHQWTEKGYRSWQIKSHTQSIEPMKIHLTSNVSAYRVALGEISESIMDRGD